MCLSDFAGEFPGVDWTNVQIPQDVLRRTSRWSTLVPKLRPGTWEIRNQSCGICSFRRIAIDGEHGSGVARATVGFSIKCDSPALRLAKQL